jgi:hypothetical protein
MITLSKNVAQVIVAIFFGCLYSSIATAKADKTKQFIGEEWEFSRILIISDSSKETFRHDDARFKGRSIYFERDGFTTANDKQPCVLNESLAQRTFPFQSLFYPTVGAHRKLVTIPFNGRLKAQALAVLPNDPVTIYGYICESGTINRSGNWFAVTRNAIVWPLVPSALAVLRRPSHAEMKQRLSFCKTLTTEPDKTICGSREMSHMKKFIDTYQPCFNRRNDITSEQAAAQSALFLAELAACRDSNDCIYDGLFNRFTELARALPPLDVCK